MCGIIGYIGKKKIVPLLLEGLKRLEYRGYDSAGIAVIDGKNLHIKRVQGKIKDLEENLLISPLDGSYGVGHTRWATHGRPTEENAHPHRDCTGTIVVVHNGIIENYLKLKNQLINEGHKFITETDTEVIAHLIEKYFKGKLEEALIEASNHLEGVYALGIISPKDPKKLIAAKYGPPMIIGIGEDEYFLSSDLAAILNHTRDVIFLEDKEIAIIQSEGVKFLNFDGKFVQKNSQKINWDPVMTEKGGFRHFMLKEIYEQPRALRETIFGRISLDTGKTYIDELNLNDEFLKNVSKIVIIACGTSWHAGLIGKYLIESISKIPAEVDYASEYRYKDLIWNKNFLGVAITQSGETADTIAAMREIKKLGGKIITICNVHGSMATREADGIIYTHAGPEIGVASTKAFTSQLVVLALLAIHLAWAKKNINKDYSISLLNELQRIPHKIEMILNKDKKIEQISQKYVFYNNFLYLGRWINYPVALEGALKLKEISYIHAEGYPAGEMKHGPIALIDTKMPTVAIATKDRVKDKVMNNISEVKTRGGEVIAIATEGDEEMKGKVDEIIHVPETSEIFTPFLNIIPLQLFAYNIAFKKGYDVDQPRNLAKSVTVE
ncbi:MAG: glutamine--fructose-6-phosphate transaminase (isomerizing) [Acidobacteriota bacterium]